MPLHTVALLFALSCLLTSCTAFSCQHIPGALVQIDAGGGQVFGVNKHDDVYALYGSSWTQLPGKLTHVTVGPAGVWGVNRGHQIFKLVAAKWLNVPGLLKQVDAGGRFVAGVNHENAPFCLPMADTIGFVHAGSDANWVHIPGGLKYYACGPYSCWGVNKADQVFVRKGVNSTHCQGVGSWKLIPGSLCMIEVGGDGCVFGVNPAGQLLRRESLSASTPEGNGWKHIPLYSGQVKRVSYDMGHVWLILKNGDIYDCTE